MLDEFKTKYDEDMSKIKQVIANLVDSMKKCETAQKQEIAEQLIRSGTYSPTDRLESVRKDGN